MGLKIGYTELKRIEGRLADIRKENHVLISKISTKFSSINNNVKEDELGLSTTMNELANRFVEESGKCIGATARLQEMLSTMLTQVNVTTENVQQDLQKLSANMEIVSFDN